MNGQAPTRYFADTTVWIDYFSPSSADPEKNNVKSWVANFVQNVDVEVHITDVVLLELMSHFYYSDFFRMSSKTIRKILRTLVHSFNVREATSDVWETCSRFDWLPRALVCHVGELSFLHLLHEPGSVLVTSDDNVLRAFVFVERIDPRKEPPVIIAKGESVS